MQRSLVQLSALICFASLSVGVNVFAQQPAGAVPLFFQTEWKIPTGQHFVTTEDLTNSNLELQQYGQDTKITDPKIEHGIVADAQNGKGILWTGVCNTPCAAAMKDKNNYADLTGFAKIRWRVWANGLHQIRPILKLADGTWLVGDYADGFSTEFHDSEFYLSDVRWFTLNIEKVGEKNGKTWVKNPDLSKVDEIGFADLMPGTGHNVQAASRITRMEVYGAAVKREPAKATTSK